ncbi:MAG: inactive transglutaminase family protein [Sulfuricurvum sp.]
MKNRAFFYALVAFIATTGVVLATLRHYETGMPFFSNERMQIWDIEAKVEFMPTPQTPILVSLNIPDASSGILYEQSVSSGYGFNISYQDGSRRGEWSKREANTRQTIYYKIQLKQEGLSGDESYMGVPEAKILWSEAEALAADEVLKEAYEASSDEISFTKELIKIASKLESSKNSSILFRKRNYDDVLTTLLSQAGVSHRVSMVLRLEDARRNQSLRSIIEVKNGDGWLFFDPKKPTPIDPKEYFFWSRGGKSLIDLVGASNAHVSFAMLEHNIPAIEVVKSSVESGVFNFFSVHRLPIEEQSFFKILLLIPIGALITVFMRLIVGVRTSGTFMPVLLAMAFLQTTLFLGAINFIVLVAIGLMIRSYLSWLNLLLVARIATIITIVIFLVGVMAIVGYEFGFNSRMSVAFFPIVILSWTIERMSILWEEEGAKEVMIQGGGSMLIAVLVYLAMQNGYIAHLCFNFPEINLIAIALMMLMGRYAGYRLFELYRFRDFRANS